MHCAFRTSHEGIYYQQVQFADIGAKTLVFAIYDFDRFSKHDQIGQIKVPLNSIDLGNVIEEWRDVASPESDSEKVIITRTLGGCRICQPLASSLKVQITFVQYKVR